MSKQVPKSAREMNLDKKIEEFMDDLRNRGCEDPLASTLDEVPCEVSYEELQALAKHIELDWTIKEVTDNVNFTPYQIRKAIRKGDLPGQEIGGTVFIRFYDLIDYTERVFGT